MVGVIVIHSARIKDCYGDELRVSIENLGNRRAELFLGIVEASSTATVPGAYTVVLDRDGVRQLREVVRRFEAVVGAEGGEGT